LHSLFLSSHSFTKLTGLVAIEEIFFAFICKIDKSICSSIDNFHLHSFTKLASFVAVGEHVPGISFAFSAVSPLLASIMFVPAVVAKSARLGAVGEHVSGVLLAFAVGRPAVAFGVLVLAIRPVSISAAATAAVTAARFSTAVARWHAVAVVSRLQFVSEIVFDATAFAGAEPGAAGALGAGLGTDAGALVVLVARLLTGRVGGAVRVAAVHHVHDSLVRVGQMLFVADRELKILISGEDRHFIVVGEGPRAVVHDGAVIVRHPKGTRSLLLVKVEPLFPLNIVQLNDESLVSVQAALLVMQTNRVPQFVKNGGVVEASRQ